MRPALLIACAGLAALAVPVSAQQAAAEHACPAGASVELPADLAGWNAPQPLTAAKDAAGLDAAQLALGQAADATLIRTAEVEYPVRPERPGGSVSFGGLFRFDVAEAGTYRVAIGSAAWIDVLSPANERVQSGKFGHGPECSGIRKMVEFALTPGTHTLLIAANGQAQMAVLIDRLP
ncbi:hypothetical protein GRI97_16755 [Altererythrobacter xixiisoli]|uniref:Homogentisate 1,2-dioxygenase n=1 Tax=Croceibacterium xixiisoli TaxID=1476466 RepID=A0A6I4TXJ4_9SPHN|nr:hypothetical protein [Croceibacterium xixiisoli]MXP00643.1 hypothetical protein [Croceibacterium xixiisoli]